jgi:hypothetical protein
MGRTLLGAGCDGQDAARVGLVPTGRQAVSLLTHHLSRTAPLQ